MFKFGLSQKLSSLLFLSIGVSILLGLSLPAEGAVNSPTLTVLDMGEMSQIAGGTCKEVQDTGGGDVGRCESHGTLCGHGLQCGTNPYTIIYHSQYCKSVTSGGYYACYCAKVIPAWESWNCQKCTLFWCSPKRDSFGGYHWHCTADAYCPYNGG